MLCAIPCLSLRRSLSRCCTSLLLSSSLLSPTYLPALLLDITEHAVLILIRVVNRVYVGYGGHLLCKVFLVYDRLRCLHQAQLRRFICLRTFRSNPPNTSSSYDLQPGCKYILPLSVKSSRRLVFIMQPTHIRCLLKTFLPKALFPIVIAISSI